LNAGGALTSYAYEPGGNRLDAIDSTDVALDANGNTTAEGARSFTHTAQNRLFEVYDGGNLTVTYAYNRLGRRITKTFPDGTGRRYVYATNGELLAETSLAGTVLIEYVYLNGTLIAQYQPDSDADGQTNWEAETQGGQSALLDTDRDGLSDATELALQGTHPDQADSDGDGFCDGYEVAQQTDPLDPGRMPTLAQGDLSGDGELGIGDALRLVGFAMDLTEPTTQVRAAADMDLDGEITADDGALLLRQILGMAQPAQLKVTDPSLTQRLLAWLLDTVIEPAHANPPGLGKIYYVHTDHLGTPLAMTDEAGIKVWSAVYDPFGATTPDKDPDGNGSAVALNVRFPGQYYDQETGLHYNAFRTYDPATGRYITSDPIGLQGGLNTYAYAHSNPVRWSDPTGLDVWFGGEGTASAHLLLFGGSGGIGSRTNLGTGETCSVRTICGRIGFGILVGGGGRALGSVLAPHCGKDIGGTSFQVGGDIIVPGGGGAGGALSAGGGLGAGINAGPEGGAGFSFGIDVCKVQVLGCTNTPEDCKECSQ